MVFSFFVIQIFSMMMRLHSSAAHGPAMPWREAHADIESQWVVGDMQSIQTPIQQARPSWSLDDRTNYTGLTLKVNFSNFSSHGRSDTSSGSDSSSSSTEASPLAAASGRRLMSGWAMRSNFRSHGSGDGDLSSNDANNNDASDSDSPDHHGGHLYFYFHHAFANLAGDGSIDQFSLANGTFSYHHSHHTGGGDLGGGVPTDGGGLGSGVGGIGGIGSGVGGPTPTPEPASMASIACAAMVIMRRRTRRA